MMMKLNNSKNKNPTENSQIKLQDSAKNVYELFSGPFDKLIEGLEKGKELKIGPQIKRKGSEPMKG